MTTSTTAWTTTIETAFGPFTLVADDDAVLASGWTADTDELVALIAPALRPATIRRSNRLGPFTAAAAAYHDGDVTAIDAVPVHARSGTFIEQAWKALRTIEPGTVITYTKLAERAGHTAAVRAAANACARNPAALFVPCHRVLRIGGGLGGFGWGLDIKRRLLAHEGVALGQTPLW